MSPLISRILLAIFMLPLAALVYMAVYVPIEHSHILGSASNRWDVGFVIAGMVAWAFIATYWTLLWRKSVRLTAERVGRSVAAGVVACFVATAIALPLGRVEEGFGYFIASAIAPMLWVIATIFISYETAAERTERLRTLSRDDVVCPNCEYNLTGLTSTRCPECGTQFTLDELMAAQPARESAELE
ncbi:MAG: hypothetical protein JWL69_5250 [Phycisphaerales bacterium]|nr:hypothetical protein [Phycisphaerales bacterium]